MSIKAAFGVEAKRPYLAVKSDLAKARAEFQEIFKEHEAVALKADRYEVYRDSKRKFRESAIKAGIITPDDDFNDAYAVPPRMTVPDELQERFHRQYYINAQLEAEEASYSAIEKGNAFVLAAASSGAHADA